MTTQIKKIEWKCPQCGSDPNVHNTTRKPCLSRTDSCMGFICECEEDTDPEHGTVLSNVCRTAYCYHCGWGGTFPSPPKKLTGWAKKAWDAGWLPPAGWTP